MKFESHETREKPLNNRTQFLFLTFAILLSGLVFGWFVWQITNSGAASVFLVFGLSLLAWLAVVRSLQKSHQALLQNNAEKEKAEAALRQSEQYRNLFRHANDAILIFEPETEIVLEVNDKACEIYQRRREDFIGRSLLEMSPHEPCGTEKLEKLMNGEACGEFETVHLRGDGAPIHLTINAAVIEYQGRLAILSINHDVTARKKIEEERRASEEHLRSVAQSARDAIISADSRGNIVFWNQEAEKMFGYTETEIIGKSLQMIMPAVHREAHQTSLERNVATGENHLVGKTVEVQGSRKDGTEFPLELSLGSWESAKGKFFTAVLRDITDRKAAENALRQSERQYRLLGEGIRHQIWTAQPDGKLDYVNQRTLEYFGRTMEEAINGGWEDVIHPDDLKTCMERWKESLATGADYEVEFRLKRADGTYLWHIGRATAGRDEDGKIVKWFGTNSEIESQKRAEKQMSESRQMLQLVMDTIPQAIWWKDQNSVFLGANQFLARIAGFETPDEMIGLTDYDMPWTREEADAFRTCDRRVMETGAGELGIIEQQTQADGKQAWVSANKVPLRSEDSRVIGVLGTFEDITEKRRADQALHESEYKLRTLFDNMTEGLVQVDNNEVIEFVNNRFCEMSGYSREELIGRKTFDFIYDEEGRKFVLEAGRQRQKGESGQYELRLRQKNGDVLYAIVGGVPIMNAENEIVGTMGVFTDITERKRFEEQLLHDAFHDGLTGLANRALFMDYLQRTIERGKNRHSGFYAVLFLDFDRFKVINDSLGHLEGDKFLKIAAHRLARSTRAGDLVARLGGDEFVILLSELPDPDEALAIAARIQEDLKEPFEFAGREIFVSASIGIALSTAGHTKAEDLLRDADIAMYRAKTRGRGQFQVFDQSMHEHASKQLSLETEMRRALEREEFELYYQPIINLEEETLMGFEALVRWRHPSRGLITPFEFVPVAEESGLILPLGKWILQESCRRLRRWQIENPQAENLTMSVNLSCKQFAQTDLAGQIARTLAGANLDPRRLKLEITESHVMDNSDQAIDMMNELRALGVEISLDDFGTGYSNLSYLHRLPASFLKIDRSFVMRMTESEEHSEIVQTIIRLAQNLKMKVVAEGIETAGQLAYLKYLKCEFGQGYYFSKPLNADDAKKLIDQMPIPSLILEHEQAKSLHKKA